MFFAVSLLGGWMKTSTGGRSFANLGGVSEGNSILPLMKKAYFSLFEAHNSRFEDSCSVDL